MMTSFKIQVIYYHLSIAIDFSKNPYHAVKFLETIGRINHPDFRAQSNRHFGAIDAKKRIVNVVMARGTNV